MATGILFNSIYVMRQFFDKAYGLALIFSTSLFLALIIVVVLGMLYPTIPASIPVIVLIIFAISNVVTLIVGMINANLYDSEF